MQLLWQVLSDDSVGSDADLRCRALAVWSWVSMDCTLWCPGSTYDDSIVKGIFLQVTKALVMRSHARGKEAAIKVCECVCLCTCKWGVNSYLNLFHAHPSFSLSLPQRTPPSQLLSILGDPVLSTAAAKGFQLILSDVTDVLNRRCQANVRVGMECVYMWYCVVVHPPPPLPQLMYKQKFFMEIVPEIVRQFHEGVPGQSQPVLVS